MKLIQLKKNKLMKIFELKSIFFITLLFFNILVFQLHSNDPQQPKREKIIHQLYEIGAIKFGKFTLKSGIESPFYIDMRLIISFPELFNDILLLVS